MPFSVQSLSPLLNRSRNSKGSPPTVTLNLLCHYRIFLCHCHHYILCFLHRRPAASHYPATLMEPATTNSTLPLLLLCRRYYPLPQSCFCRNHHCRWLQSQQQLLPLHPPLLLLVPSAAVIASRTSLLVGAGRATPRSSKNVWDPVSVLRSGLRHPFFFHVGFRTSSSSPASGTCCCHVGQDPTPNRRRSPRHHSTPSPAPPMAALPLLLAVAPLPLGRAEQRRCCCFPPTPQPPLPSLSNRALLCHNSHLYHVVAGSDLRPTAPSLPSSALLLLPQSLPAGCLTVAFSSSPPAASSTPCGFFLYQPPVAPS
ncbi:hypothetical protein GW17_00034489 [Ensete ventricosum]|nr:hypothetical protein GW17_00034489 [Ensete ventricosum]